MSGVATFRKALGRQVRRILAPRPTLTVSEWAAQHRILSRESSAEPGRWERDRNPPMNEIMDAIGDPAVEQVVVKAASQSGKTETLMNALGWSIDRDPGPALWVMPTLEMARTVSLDRIGPMFRDTPALHSLVPSAAARDSNATIFERRGPGWYLALTGANAPAALSSRPIRRVFGDEIDRFPDSAGGEGSPIDLAWKRAAAFPNRKLVLCSTPTLRDVSAIEAWYLAGDQRQWQVACPSCGERAPLQWADLRWEKTEAGEHRPETVAWACPACGSLVDETGRRALVASGVWVPGNPGARIRSYHVNALASPFLRWEEIVRDFLAAKHDRAKLQVWVNTVTAEVYDPQPALAAIANHRLAGRLERYAAEVPAGVTLLVAGCDVQGNRLEVSVVGFGAEEEAWLIHHEPLMGSPSERPVWALLDQLLAREWSQEGGSSLRIALAGIDTGGHSTAQVYDYVALRQARAIGRLVAFKGHPSPGFPLLARRPKLTSNNRVRLWAYGSNAAKDLFYGRLAIEAPGPGYLHLPDSVDKEYLQQLLAEEAEAVRRQGVTRRVYKKLRARSEALDCWLYCLLALRTAGPAVVRRLGTKPGHQAAAVEAAAGELVPAGAAQRSSRRPAFLPPSRQGWITRW